MFTTVNLTPRIGTEINADRDIRVNGFSADEIRELLERRGAFVFRRLHCSDSEQVGCAGRATPDDPR